MYNIARVPEGYMFVSRQGKEESHFGYVCLEGANFRANISKEDINVWASVKLFIMI